MQQYLKIIFHLQLLPSILRMKEKLIFSNIQELTKFVTHEL